MAIQFRVSLFLLDENEFHLGGGGMRATLMSIRQTDPVLHWVLRAFTFIMCSAETVGAAATQENCLIYEALHFPLVQIVTGPCTSKKGPAASATSCSYHDKKST